MAEYINREELLKDIEDSVRFSTRNGVSAELRGAHKIVDCIRSAPACDVVEVVRCSECQHRGKNGLCQAEGQELTIAKDNHFCSKGERRLDNG